MLSVVTASTVEPVSVAEVKAQARIDHAEEDDLIAAYLTAARQWCEAYVTRPLAGSAVSYKLILDNFCDPRYMRGDIIYVPIAPFIGLTSVTYSDADGDTQLFTGSLVDTAGEPARIQPTLGEYWPAVRDRIASVDIRFQAGYSAIASVPQGCKTAIKMLAAHWYEHREPVVTGTIIQDVPFGLQALLDPHKWGGYL